MTQRELSPDAVEYVKVTVTSTDVPDFPAASIELSFGRGPWVSAEVVTPTAAGVAVVRALVDGSTLAPGAHAIRARLVDAPETVVVDAGRLVIG